MNSIKSLFVRTAVALAFVVSGCASVSAPFDSGDILTSMQDSSQAGGE